jgi:hypothetical protein
MNRGGSGQSRRQALSRPLNTCPLLAQNGHGILIADVRFGGEADVVWSPADIAF